MSVRGVLGDVFRGLIFHGKMCGVRGVNFYGGNWNIRGECAVGECVVGQISGSCLGKNFAGRGRVIFRGRNMRR